MACEVVETGTGYVVRLTWGRHTEYCGKDGYWSRIIDNAAEFPSRDAAQDVADAINDDDT